MFHRYERTATALDRILAQIALIEADLKRPPWYLGTSKELFAELKAEMLSHPGCIIDATTGDWLILEVGMFSVEIFVKADRRIGS